MNRISRIGTQLGMFVVVGALAIGCSSSSGTTSGTGGAASSGTGGTASSGTGGAASSGTGGSASTGTGGAGGSASTGTGGAGGSAGSTAMYAACPSGVVKDKGACVSGTDAMCSNTCGPSKTGYKNCTCNTDVWGCDACTFPMGADYSCYKLPATVPACPADATDPAGTNLVQNGSACTAAACMPCGSGTLSAYRDSSNTAKVGYCVCVAGASSSKWSCASTKEWPTQ